MPTTTNYGWTTPADTDLVKDGAAAIRTLGSSIDTSVKSLNAGTTAGDLDYYTSATTKARIGIGTNGQVLKSNGSVPSWGDAPTGGMTLISTTTLSGATVTLSSIPQTYVDLVLYFWNATNATANGRITIRPNGATGSRWSGVDNATAFYSSSSIQTNANNDRTNDGNTFVVKFFDYNHTSVYGMPFQMAGYYYDGSVGRGLIYGGTTGTASAITSIDILNTGGNWSAGTVKLYGVK